MTYFTERYERSSCMRLVISFDRCEVRLEMDKITENICSNDSLDI